MIKKNNLEAKEDKDNVLDLAALATIEEEIVEVGGQKVTVTMLVPQDVEKCRKLIMTHKLDEGLAMEYLTFLACKKKHPEITWFKFKDFNFKVVNKLMAVMAIMNGFDETFRVFGESDGYGVAASQDEDSDFGLDFD